MNKIKYFLILTVSVFFYINTQAQTADEIIKNYASALGGMDKLKELKSIKITGSMKMMGMEFPFTSFSVNPDKFYIEISVQGQSIKQGYDGSKGWIINPMTGNSLPEETDEETSEQLKARGRTIDGIFTYAEDNAKVELIESAPVDGIEVYKIKYTGSDGKVTDYYFDKNKYLIVRMEKNIKVMGKELFTETSYLNYKKFGEILFPTISEIITKESPMGNQTVYIDKIEINPVVDNSIFQMPSK